MAWQNGGSEMIERGWIIFPRPIYDQNTEMKYAQEDQHFKHESVPITTHNISFYFII